MICKVCEKEFVKKHFNQKLCSCECKKKSRKVVLIKYKNSGKRLICARRLYGSKNKKESDKKYMTSKKGRAKAVDRIIRLIKTNEYYLARKRLSQTAAYKRLRIELIKKAGSCQKCRSEKNLTLDHIKPLSIGGLHNKENIQILCRVCNASKGQRTKRYELPKV